MSRLRSIVLALSTATVLAVPLQALAASIQFDFGEERMNARWEGTGQIDGTLHSNGVLLRTTTDTGAMLTTALLPFSPDTVRLTVSADAPGSLYIVRTESTDAEGTVTMLQKEIAFSVATMQELIAPLDGAMAAEGRADLGILLPPETHVLVHDLAFSTTPWWERGIEGVRSFWAFDAYRPYSINFLWGPLLAWTPGTRAALWKRIPPPELPATYIANMLILGAVILLLFIGWRTGKRRRMRHHLLILLCCAWILFDLRMGSEYLRWVADDHAWFLTANRAEAEFRDRSHFYDFVAALRPLLSDRERYIFMAPREWPFLGNIRYLTYPAIPSNAVHDDDTWVIFDRPDVTLGEDHRLWNEGAPISTPGEVLLAFATGSFVFRTFPPSMTP